LSCGLWRLELGPHAWEAGGRTARNRMHHRAGRGLLAEPRRHRRRWEVEIQMAKREVIDKFKIMAPGGQATPAPPLGPVLGAKGVNPGQFIQQFNAETAALNGKVVGCVVTVYSDRSFEFEIKSSPASVLIKEAAGLEKASGEPQNIVGSISRDQCEKIAEEKMADLNSRDINAAMRVIEGTARSMGIKVEG